MKISELQDYVKCRLNKVEALVQGGCKAFAEDTRSVYDEAIGTAAARAMVNEIKRVAEKAA